MIERRHVPRDGDAGPMSLVRARRGWEPAAAGDALLFDSPDPGRALMPPGHLLHLARRWLWLVALAAVVGAAAGYGISRRVPMVYESIAKLLITPGQPSGTPASYDNLLRAERLSHTYAEVLKTPPMVDAATQGAGLALPYDAAVKLIDIRPVRDTQLIEVHTRGATPEASVAFANSLVAVFIRRLETDQAMRFGATKDSVSAQVDQLTADVVEHMRQADALRDQPPSAARDSELSRLQAELVLLQQSYAAAVRSYDDLRLAAAHGGDLVTIVQPASRPTAPVQPRPSRYVLIGLLAGCVSAATVAFLVEYLDDRLFTPERVARFTGLHCLASVALLPKDAPPTVYQAPPPVPARSHGADSYDAVSQVFEVFRLLRSNLQFTSVEHPLVTLAITSSDAGDGKSTTAVNLAVVVAQSGSRVVLVDADLRGPSLHGIFGVQNRNGLTSLLLDEQLQAEALLVPTRVKGLWLLPSGPLPPNPSELLATSRMRDRLRQLAASADLLILDSPPALAVSDAAILGGLVDGTLLVVNAQRARGYRVTQVIIQLQNAGARILGAVHNRTRCRAPDAGLYSYYTHVSQTPAAPAASPGAAAPQ